MNNTNPNDPDTDDGGAWDGWELFYGFNPKSAADESNDNDCAGTLGGDLKDDECGVCGGDGSTCLDCLDVPNGDAVYDECGLECIGNDPLADCSAYCDADSYNDCVKDCAGIWGGEIWEDCGYLRQ